MKTETKRKWARRAERVIESWANQFIYYDELVRELGLNLGRHACLANGLGELKKEDMEAGRPVRAARVVSCKDGRPGDGFYTDEEFDNPKSVREHIWRKQLTGEYACGG